MLFIRNTLKNDSLFHIFELIVDILKLNQRKSVILYILALILIIGGICKCKIVLYLFTIYPHNTWIVEKFGIKGLQVISVLMGVWLILIGITI